ncbi:uncharacterized protein LOC126929035 isoform X1 [Bombus affinis]|nr:uncharacterized protein LOC126929035 isoform X1 [Bombus affinis]
MNKTAIEKKYLKVVKTCSMIAGIWPDQSKFSKLFTRIIIYIISVLSLITQMANVICFFSLNTLIEQVCFFNAVVGALIKQGNYIINAAEYKMLFNAVWKDWSTDRLSDELDIMIEYAKKGAFFSWLYFGVCICCAISFLQLSLTPIVLDIISPMNETRDLMYIFPAYYYVNDQIYRTFISFHMMCTIISTCLVYIGCDTSYMYIVQHACGQLAVARHRFENAILDFSIVSETSVVQDKIYERVVHSIRGHQYATNSYLRTIQSSHSAFLFITVALGMTTLSVTLVKVASQANVSGQFIKDIVFLLAQLIHIFFFLLQGQFVLNANDEFAESIYNTFWYNTNTRTKLLLVLVLRSCSSAPNLSAGGLLVFNLKNFSEASISTLIHNY